MLQFAFGEEEGRRSHELNRHYAPDASARRV
jgi:hypothetical protein